MAKSVKGQGKKIHLNIMMDYPVKWSRFQILRDFVQNFYDAKAPEDFFSHFSHHYEQGCLTVKMSDSVFSYEWLMHIGASTKQNITAAGYFGEGFKIAALSAIRDCHWSVEMESSSWKIIVMSETIMIENQKRKELVYLLRERAFQNDSQLILRGLTPDDYECFCEVLQGFYYPENSLLGSRLYSDQDIAIYERSDQQYPASFPRSYQMKEPKGIVFCSYQVMGTLPFPLVICAHYRKARERDRHQMYEADICNLMYEIAEMLPPQICSVLLSYLKPYWRTYPKNHENYSSWYYVVCQTIRGISCSSAAISIFKKSHPDLICEERIRTKNASSINRRNTARAWLKKRDDANRFRIVQDYFCLLGYPVLEQWCEKEGGFSQTEEPNPTEKEYISVLESVANDLFSGFFPDNSSHTYRIIDPLNGVYEGTAIIRPLYQKMVNAYGRVIKYSIDRIEIKKNLLKKGCFHEALATYLHERSHIFGGDKSSAFSYAMTSAMEILIAKSDKIQIYRDKWDKIR